MAKDVTRRRFLKYVTAAGAASLPVVSAARSNSPNSRLNLACIGVGGKGKSDMAETSQGHNVVAVCDIDELVLGKAQEGFPQATPYTDWRKLLEQKNIDAVTISTPDHTHAPATMAAIRLGKHVYTQKPLTHNVFEARQLAKAAEQYGVVSQMGIQHHATQRLKTAVQIVRDGVIGKVSHVHTWTDRPGKFWKQGLDRPKKSDPIPSHVHWDQWLGVAPARPFVTDMYHRFHWRGWWDFGTGALGDMGCHILDPVVNALQLGAPSIVEAEGPPPHPESGPLWCIVHYVFPGTEHTTEELKLTWYEAGKQPPRDIFQAPVGWPGSANGVLFIGQRGNLFVGFPEPPELFPRGEFTEYQLPDFKDHNHYQEWTDAIVHGKATSCPFAYSGPLTETVLLGNVAYRSGRRIQWDSERLRAIDLPSADRFIRRDYRSGWAVAGLGS